jgi:hypothetical protein
LCRHRSLKLREQRIAERIRRFVLGHAPRAYDGSQVR